MNATAVLKFAKDNNIDLPIARSRDGQSHEILEPISLRFTVRQIEKIDHLAMKMGMTRSQFLRGAMINALDLPRFHENDGEPPKGVRGRG